MLEEAFNARAAKPSRKSKTNEPKVKSAETSISPLKMNTIEKHPQSRFKQVSALGIWLIM
jgi:hypothetical protein